MAIRLEYGTAMEQGMPDFILRFWDPQAGNEHPRRLGTVYRLVMLRPPTPCGWSPIPFSPRLDRAGWLRTTGLARVHFETVCVPLKYVCVHVSCVCSCACVQTFYGWGMEAEGRQLRL